MRPLILGFMIGLLSQLFYLADAYAATIQLQSHQGEITHDQEFIIQSSLSVQTGDGTNYYLRGVFFKEGTSDYCGFTWNGTEWFSGPYSSNEGWKKFLKAQIANNNWSGELRAKIDPDDSGCRDSGQYKFKIQRFNENSGSSNFDDQVELSLQVYIPTPTPTLVPTLKPSATPKPTATPKPQVTPKPTIQKTQIPVLPSVVKTTTQEVAGVKTNSDIPQDREDIPDGDTEDLNELFMIASREAEVKNTIPKVDAEKSKSPNKGMGYNTFSFSGGIVLLFSSCGILVMKKLREHKNE